MYIGTLHMSLISCTEQLMFVCIIKSNLHCQKQQKTKYTDGLHHPHIYLSNEQLLGFGLLPMDTNKNLLVQKCEFYNH